MQYNKIKLYFNITILLFLISLAANDLINVNQFKNKLNIAFLSSCEVKCGIAMYTNHLYKAISNLGFRVLPLNNKFNNNLIINNILSNNINVLHIQYHPGLFSNVNSLFNLVKRLKNKVKIIITVHREPNNIDLLNFIKLLNNCDKVIFHKKTDAFYKISNKKCYFMPMGVPVFNPSANRNLLRKKYGFSESDKILTTNGFMFPNKKHSIILKLIAPFIKSNQNYKVQLLTSYGNAAFKQCEVEDKSIKRVIKEYGIENQVIHLTNFLPQQELSERLWISDLGYLWNEQDSFETSAASKEFIAARLPLIVGDSSHFHDLKSGIIKTLLNKDKFVDAIINSLGDKQLLNILKIDMEILYKQLNYKKVAEKLVSIYLQ